MVMNTPCVRRTCIGVRKVFRAPVLKQTRLFVERHVVRSTVLGFVPSVVNDALVHHVQLSPTELLHVATDDVTVSSMTALAMILVSLHESTKKTSKTIE